MIYFLRAGDAVKIGWTKDSGTLAELDKALAILVPKKGERWTDGARCRQCGAMMRAGKCALGCK